MKLHWISLVGAVGFLLITAATVPTPTPYEWKLPKGFPEPYVPADNPMTVEKVELGRHLFYDTRLSGNGNQSCATCHRQNRAFGDDVPTSTGATGDRGIRKSMAIVNIVYSGTLTWSNPNQTRLEKQALVPMFGTHPVELGLDKDNSFLKDLSADPVYKKLFRAAYPEAAKPFTVDNVTKALASFQRTLVSGNSPYDRYRYQGDDQAISDQAKHGERLFFGRLGCGRCHGGFNFSDSTITAKSPERASFHNTGLYNVKGPTSYPAPNIGTAEHTKSKFDVGMFKAPTLRNIALHPPYMHDGSVPTLDAVLDHYAAGGRTIKSGPRAGVGKDNPNKDPFLNGFELSKDERAAVIAFLQSLTDREFMTNPAFGDPWPK